MPHVKVTSDGTSHGTHVLIDGREVDCTEVIIRAKTLEPVMVTVTLYVDEVDLEGPCELHTSQVVKAQRVQGRHVQD